MELSSTISFSGSSDIKTPPSNALYQIESSVNIPLSHYNKMATMYYNIAYKLCQSNGTTTNHLMKYIDAECQTESTSNSVSIETVIDNELIISTPIESIIADETIEIVAKLPTVTVQLQNTESANEITKTVSLSSSVNNSQRGERSSTKKKAYGKMTDFNCFVKLDRLSIDYIRSICYPLGDLPKISYKNSMEKQKNTPPPPLPLSSSFSSPACNKSPVPNSHTSASNLHISTKEKINQNDKPLTLSSTISYAAKPSLKRKNSGNRDKEKLSKSKLNDNKEILQAIARSFETLSEDDSTFNSIKNPDDLRS
ncbi:unnamed protein product [Rotaria magnacalcarata]|uniref:Uncharacterized protein n=1 Tax=Rotaria magnacalcarata TaxID=392030 RepID=A0A8S3EZQ0_9BILA|nr:unnamed protein product [Rotaria magnacalcarata]CAF5093468.1 unnamed protein product [Rotaria magnacalcarata]